jgi:hypothetical protein
VQWENTTNAKALQAAREELWRSWRRARAEGAGHPRAEELFGRHKLPAFHVPFAGGGALPLDQHGRFRRGLDVEQGPEHQRAGLRRRRHPRHRVQGRQGPAVEAGRTGRRLGPGRRRPVDGVGHGPSPDPGAGPGRGPGGGGARLGAGVKGRGARELAYRLYTICERKKRAAEALAYNGLVQSWPELVRLGQERRTPQAEQGELI